MPEKERRLKKFSKSHLEDPVWRRQRRLLLEKILDEKALSADANVRSIFDWYILWLLDRSNQEEKLSDCKKCHEILGHLPFLTNSKLCNENWVAQLLRQKKHLGTWNSEEQEEFLSALRLSQELCAKDRPLTSLSDVKSVALIHKRFPEFKSCPIFKDIFEGPGCEYPLVTCHQGANKKEICLKVDKRQGS